MTYFRDMSECGKRGSLSRNKHSSMILLTIVSANTAIINAVIILRELNSYDKRDLL